MRRWAIAGGLAALLTAVLLTTFAFTGPELVSTENIDAIDHYTNGSLHAATFVPGVPREEVVRKALESAGRVIGGRDTSTLETRATVGLYTWKDEEGNWVERRKAWLVVVDDLPVTFSAGPPENAAKRSHQRQQNQLVIFYDADTGEEIERAISGRWVDKENPVGPLLVIPPLRPASSGDPNMKSVILTLLVLGQISNVSRDAHPEGMLTWG